MCRCELILPSSFVFDGFIIYNQGFKDDSNGNCIVVDLINGTEINCDRKMGRDTENGRITQNLTVYESQEHALSERFPSNQAGLSIEIYLTPQTLVLFSIISVWSTMNITSILFIRF